MSARAPLFGILGAILLAVAFWFLLYQPRADEQTALEAETARLESEQQTLRNEIARLREVEANQVQIAAQLARLEEYVPSSTAQPAFIRQLQISADAAGLEILSVTFGDPSAIDGAPPTGEEGTALASIPVTVNVQGGYFQAVDLFRRLETEVIRAVLIGDVGMGEGGDNFPQLTTSWGGAIFAVVPITQAPAPAPVPTEPNGAPTGSPDGAPDSAPDGTGDTAAPEVQS
jgi:Tfp pilus assembly protein PilO